MLRYNVVHELADAQLEAFIGRNPLERANEATMANDEVQAVLTNWIREALSPIGKLAEGTDPAAWVASRFAEWWNHRVAASFADTERAVSAVREELMRLGGWKQFGEALEEVTHAADALDDMRSLLGLPEE